MLIRIQYNRKWDTEEMNKKERLFFSEKIVKIHQEMRANKYKTSLKNAS